MLIGLGVVVSACSPPQEQPSDVKVDTATSFRAAPASQAVSSTSAAPAPLPGVIECVGAPEFEPESLALACADDDDRLVDITWDTWTPEKATGTAVRETTERGRTERTRDVEVELSEPVRSPQGLVFTRVTVDDEEIIL